MMTTPNTESVIATPCPDNATPPPGVASDVNENNSKGQGSAPSPAVSSMSDNAVPLVAAPAALGTTMPLSQVSTPNVVGFPSGMNLTISNGIINVKNPNGGESTLLVAPATSLSTSSISSSASAPIPITMVKGSLPVISAPASTVTLTTPSASLLSNAQVTQTHTQLKVPNPTTIQVRPQVYNTLQSNNIAMVMQNRLSLPFQATGGQTLTVPTSIGTLRSLAPGTVPVPATSVLSPQVQFQTVAPLRGAPVTIAGSHPGQQQPGQAQFQTVAPLRGAPVTIAGSHPGQQQPGQAQPMSIRSATATAFPVLLNRNLALAEQFYTISGRPQLIAQPTRLAPRQIGTQVALQVAGQQPVSGTAIMPLFRPAQTAKPVGGITGTIVSNSAVNVQAQGQQPQLVNQVVAAAAANMPGMTHINFRPGIPATKVLERPQKLTDARLRTAVPVTRFTRPSGPITITTLSSSVLTGGDAVLSAAQSTPENSVAGTSIQGKIESKVATPEKKKLENTCEAQVKKVAPSLTTAVSSQEVVTSVQVLAQQLVPKSSAGKDASPKASGQASSAEGKKGEGGDIAVTAPSSEFDALKAMEWSDGIASLPGSNLKFKLNEFGLMEMVADDSPQSVKTVVDSAVGVNTTNFTITAALPSDAGVSDTQAEIPKKEKEPLKKCENCGKYGYQRDFCKTGRFCSQTCVGTFAGRKNKQPGGHSILNNKMMLNLKKKQKKLSTEENHITVPTSMAEPDVLSEREKTSASAPGRKPKGFDWQAYLDEVKAVGAPARLFKDPFPSQKNGFKPGMRLEGVDPKHQNLFCVLSVAEIQGYRLRLHFDGYSECYDFWTNADSPFIFPVGWCEKNNKPLQPPKHVPKQNFSWATYLRTTKSIAAPKSLFINQPATMVTPSAFRVGMKIEAVDRKNTVLICVATVADILGDKVLVHFDGWEDIYDYWCDITSPYIHPMGWCQENARLLSPPCDWPDIESFTWEDYLMQTKSQAVPARAFKPRSPVAFEVGMRAEVVDRRNPILVRVATIQEVKEHQVLVHFDSWPDMYDYWLDDDSPDIKPPGWCSRTGSKVEPPYVEDIFQHSSCPTPGCNGVGHIKGAKYVGHHSAFGCPYSSVNMNKESTLQDRLGSTRSEEGSAAPLAVRVKMESGEIRKCPTPGCDSSGHITGKFTSHHRLSGCPLYEKNVMRMNAELAARPMVRPGRGRKRKHFGDSDLKEEDGQQVKKERLESTASSFMENIHQSVFLSSVPATPSQEGPAFWDYHARLLPGVSEFKGDDVKEWTVDQVASFIGSLPGCREVENNFREQQIDGDSFLLMTQADIVKILNVKLGPALKIFTSVVFFQQTVDS
ncbi:lethal(3)malignant brain tumor-like protein 3 isoform X2 [Babylonia areolata]|uniref:lethal(3)malignant brain tumor-like protein 3 isoform X2 n=1 Tax=Babylonia areolata TaxID=304850 RepID=UPI003FD29A61